MTFQLHILDPRNRLSAEQFQAIETGVHEGVRLISEHVPVQKISFIVQLAEFPSYGGRAYGPESATLWFNPCDFNADETTYRNVAHLTVHELHHVLRWASLDLKSENDWTPGEILALEGLATQCELFLGFPLSNCVMNLTSDLVEPWLTKVTPVVSDSYLDHPWIDDALAKPTHPHRAASAMGHVLCGRYLERSGETPLSAIHKHWTEIWTGGYAS